MFHLRKKKIFYPDHVSAWAEQWCLHPTSSGGQGYWSRHKMALLFVSLFGASDDTPLHSDKLSCIPYWQLSLCNSVHGFLADALIKLPTVYPSSQQSTCWRQIFPSIISSSGFVPLSQDTSLLFSACSQMSSFHNFQISSPTIADHVVPEVLLVGSHQSHSGLHCLALELQQQHSL